MGMYFLPGLMRGVVLFVFMMISPCPRCVGINMVFLKEPTVIYGLMQVIKK